MKYAYGVLVAGMVTTFLTASPAEAATTTSEIIRDGAVLFHERTPVNTKPVTGKGVTRSDFDGDGRDDLAVQHWNGVSVSYSSAPHRDQLNTENPPGSGNFGTEMVTGNFNGDRYDDLVVADPYEADLRLMGYRSGSVWIFPGGPGGLQPQAVKHINQSSAGVPGTAEEGDSFGATLAAGDITGDGRDDLAIGIPIKKVSGKKEAGAVVVLKGSASGIVTSGARWISQATGGVPSGPETRDHFGRGLAIGKIDKNKYADLVIGAPQEDDGTSWEGNGLITQFWGSAAGVSFKKVTTVSGRQVSLTVKLRDTYAWYLGENLAIGDTTGDGYGEVIDGNSSAQVAGEIYPGLVVSLAGRKTGLSAKGVIVISQNSKGVEGGAESDDRFGDAIAVGDVTGDKRADVLVGVPNEGVGSNKNAGSVVLLKGSAKGLTGVGSQTISQNSAGVPDSVESGDHFGASVALLNLNGTGGFDAVIGSPDEHVTGDQKGYGSGSVTRLYGSAKGLGSGNVTNGRFLGVLGANYGWEIAG